MGQSSPFTISCMSRAYELVSYVLSLFLFSFLFIHSFLTLRTPFALPVHIHRIHLRYVLIHSDLANLPVCSADDKSDRYVAQENIDVSHEIIGDMPPQTLMEMAGRYFKRWDDEKRMFVSNIRDEYPDD